LSDFALLFSTTCDPSSSVRDPLELGRSRFFEVQHDSFLLPLRSHSTFGFCLTVFPVGLSRTRPLSQTASQVRGSRHDVVFSPSMDGDAEAFFLFGPPAVFFQHESCAPVGRWHARRLPIALQVPQFGERSGSISRSSATLMIRARFVSPSEGRSFFFASRPLQDFVSLQFRTWSRKSSPLLRTYKCLLAASRNVSRLDLHSLLRGFTFCFLIVWSIRRCFRRGKVSPFM